MASIVLISCVGQKRPAPSRAADLYTSDWFRSALAYANGLIPDAIFILSAKYGLVSLDDVIEPYEETLKGKPDSDIRTWAGGVTQSLLAVADLHEDHFVILAGEHYRRHLVGHLMHVSVPLQGMRIGEQLSFLKRACT